MEKINPIHHKRAKKNPGQEHQMLVQWLWKKHRGALQWRGVRLGIVPNHEMAKMYAVTLRFADAIFIEDGIVNIVEAKLKPDLGAIGQLEGYRELLKVTPEFDQVKNLPVQLILLTQVVDLVIAELASKKDIIYEVFEPEFKE